MEHKRATIKSVILESVQRDRSPKNYNPQSCHHLLASHVTSNLYNFLSSFNTTLEYFG